MADFARNVGEVVRESLGSFGGLLGRAVVARPPREEGITGFLAGLTGQPRNNITVPIVEAKAPAPAKKPPAQPKAPATTTASAATGALGTYGQLVEHYLRNTPKISATLLNGIAPAMQLTAPPKARSAADVFGDRLAYAQDLTFKKELDAAAKISDPAKRNEAEMTAWQKYEQGNQAAWMRGAVMQAQLAEMMGQGQ